MQISGEIHKLSSGTRELWKVSKIPSIWGGSMSHLSKPWGNIVEMVSAQIKQKRNRGNTLRSTQINSFKRHLCSVQMCLWSQTWLGGSSDGLYAQSARGLETFHFCSSSNGESQSVKKKNNNTCTTKVNLGNRRSIKNPFLVFPEFAADHRIFSTTHTHHTCMREFDNSIRIFLKW